MVVVLIVCIVILVFLVIILLFNIIKWVFRKKSRVITIIVLGLGMLVIIATYQLFFVQMEMIQSKVYPNIYLIKNPIKNRDSLNIIIKEMIVQKMDAQIDHNKEILKTKYKYGTWSLPEIDASIRFYEYYNSWGIHPFGEAGTAHFIENKEDPGGFSSELLEHYQTYKISEFSLRYCNIDSNAYYGHLTHWRDGVIIKKEKLFNSCKK